MLPCILHIGQPKTGTTSIQSTLFWRLRDPRFRLVTLDTVFGNRAVQAAFLEAPEAVSSVFLATVPRPRLPSLAADSRRHLDRALEAARRRGVTPLLSAEAAWWFTEAEFEALRRFVVERGFQPKVICYLRSPRDMLQSMFQQSVRIGRSPWDVVKEDAGRCSAAPVVDRVDRVFGRQDVQLFAFDPDRFPGRCVVRHFCAVAGIDLDPASVLRENDSLNLEAVRFLHAFNLGAAGDERRAVRVRRAALIRVLSDLPGPPLALHDDVLADATRSIEPLPPGLEERLGHPFPASRPTAVRLRAESELFDYGPEALEWLARKTGRRVVAGPRGEDVAAQVGGQLARLASRSVGALSAVAAEAFAMRWQRRRLMFRMGAMLG